MKQVFSAGGIVTKKENGKLLLCLIKHEDGFLVFSKGHMDAGETKEKAALREVEEETGLTNLTITKRLGNVIRPSTENSGEKVKKTISLFLMQPSTYEHKGADEEYGWFTYQQAIDGLGFEQEKSFLVKRWQQIIQSHDR